MDGEPKPFDVVLYHALKPGFACHDGFCGAWAAYRHARIHDRDSVLAIPLVRGEAMPTDLLDQVRGKRVLMVDFAYEDVDTMRKLTDACGEFVLLDHHRTAMDLLQGDSRWHGSGFREAVWKMDESGALIAWKCLFPEEPVPGLVSYTADRDLWTFKLPYAREVAAHMQSLRCSFEAWDSLYRVMDSPEGFESVVNSGAAIERYKTQLVDLITEEPLVADTLLGPVAFANSACLQSEIGERLAQDRLFAVVWWVHGESIHLSFRSQGDFDVSLLAKELGGGGHARAAGARVPMWSGADMRDPVVVVVHDAIAPLVRRKKVPA